MRPAGLVQEGQIRQARNPPHKFTYPIAAFLIAVAGMIGLVQTWKLYRLGQVSITTSARVVSSVYQPASAETMGGYSIEYSYVASNLHGQQTTFTGTTGSSKNLAIGSELRIRYLVDDPSFSSSEATLDFPYIVLRATISLVGLIGGTLVLAKLMVAR